MSIKKFSKDDYERLDYTADYSEEMAELSDSLATSVWIMPSASLENDGTTAIVLADNVTVDYSVSAPSPKYDAVLSGAVTLNGNKTTAFIDGGTLEQTYRIMNRVTTTGGRHYSRVFDLRIQRKGC
jgi:roadblock/LC7 domain-containing protein